MSMVQIAPAEVEGKLLAIVAGDGNLTLQLTLGRSELYCTEGFLHHTVQFLAHQPATAIDVMVVAAKVDTPNAGIAIG